MKWPFCPYVFYYYFPFLLIPVLPLLFFLIFQMGLTLTKHSRYSHFPLHSYLSFSPNTQINSFTHRNPCSFPLHSRSPSLTHLVFLILFLFDFPAEPSSSQTAAASATAARSPPPKRPGIHPAAAAPAEGAALSPVRPADASAIPADPACAPPRARERIEACHGFGSAYPEAC